MKLFFMLLEKNYDFAFSFYWKDVGTTQLCLSFFFFKALFLKGISVQTITSFGENVVTQVHVQLEYEIVCKCKNHADC